MMYKNLKKEFEEATGKKWEDRERPEPKPRIDYRQTENIIFKYFAYIKINQYFAVGKVSELHNPPEFEIKDISNILNNLDLTDFDQDNLIYWGIRQRRPMWVNSREHDHWTESIKKIHDVFKKKGIIKHDN